MKIFYLFALLLFSLLTIAQDIDTTLWDGPSPYDDGFEYKEPSIYRAAVLSHRPFYPKGGYLGLSEWCSEHTIYTQNMADSGIYGRVWFQVVIDSLGKFSNPRHSKREKIFDHPVLVKESLRLISKFPLFTPGRRNGKNVSSEYFFALNYKQDTLWKGKKSIFVNIYPRKD